MSLCQNARLTKSASLKCRQANVTISNARFASLLSRGVRLASQIQNARAASVLQNVNSAFLNLASLKLAKLTFLSDGKGQKGAEKSSSSETRGWSLRSPASGSKGLVDKEEECSSNHSTMLL